MRAIYSILIAIYLKALLAHADECQDAVFSGCACDTDKVAQVSKFVYCNTSNTFPQRTKPTQAYEVSSLTLMNINEDAIADDSFAFLDIRVMYLKNMKINKIGMNTLRNVRSLVDLNLDSFKFDTIERYALYWIKYSLKSLTINKMDFKALNTLLIELNELPYLTKLTLTNNNLDGLFNPDWMMGFRNLERLTIESNNLNSFGMKKFRRFPNLNHLTIKGNNFNSIKTILDALENVFTPNLAVLDLSANQIDSLELQDLDMFSGLVTLYLNQNNLKSLPKDYSKSLKSLSSWSLSGNKLSDANELDELGDMTTFYSLSLDNNLYTKLPNMNKLTNLNRLIMSNQNNNLRELRNFEFDLNTMNMIDLINNNISSIANRAFCSHYSNTSIANIKLDHDTFKLINKCQFKQIKERSAENKTVLISIHNYVAKKDGEGQTILSEICNCDLFKYAESQRIQLVNFDLVCPNFDTKCEKYDQKAIDTECSRKTEFICDAKYDTPTTTPVTTTTRKNKSTPSIYVPNLFTEIILLLCLLLFLCCQ